MTVDEFVNSIVELEAENAALKQECESHKQIKEAEKNILLEEVAKNAALSERMKAVEELVDGALAIVEIWDAPSVYQIKWKKEWIEKARQAIRKAGGKP